MALALHPTTSAAISRFVAHPSHAVLITGAIGIGKTCIADLIAAQLLVTGEDALDLSPYLRRIRSDDAKAISIEPIRLLQHFLSLKVPGAAAVKRVIIIEQGHLLTIEAQNALLKTLEEPPQDTVIILTAPSSASLLPTVASRLQTLPVVLPTREAMLAVMPNADFNSFYAIAGGLPGLLHALIHDKAHPLAEAVQVARTLLAQSNYERLLQVDALAKNKTLALNTLFILQQMAHFSLQTAAGSTSKRWQAILSASYQAAEAIDSSGNAKLALTNAFLHL